MFVTEEHMVPIAGFKKNFKTKFKETQKPLFQNLREKQQARSVRHSAWPMVSARRERVLLSEPEVKEQAGSSVQVWEQPSGKRKRDTETDTETETQRKKHRDGEKTRSYSVYRLIFVSSVQKGERETEKVKTQRWRTGRLGSKNPSGDLGRSFKVCKYTLP